MNLISSVLFSLQGGERKEMWLSSSLTISKKTVAITTTTMAVTTMMMVMANHQVIPSKFGEVNEAK